MVGLGVTAAAFIAFALASSFLFPRFRPNYPGRALPAFIVVCFVFFFGMLTAVEVFAEEPEGEEHAAETTPAPEPEPTTTTTESEPTTTEAQETTTTAPTPQASTVDVTETEFKIALASTELKAGKVTFDVTNAGAIPHDLAIVGVKQQTKQIPSKGSAKLTVTLKPGTYELYCSVPGHKQAGMDLKVTVG
jgi:plastocyanin